MGPTQNQSVKLAFVAVAIAGLVFVHPPMAATLFLTALPPSNPLPPALPDDTPEESTALTDAAEREPALELERTNERQDPAGDMDDVNLAALDAWVIDRKNDVDSRVRQTDQECDYLTLVNSLRQEQFTGDLDEIRERGVLRVLISMGRTNFFFSHGEIRGFEYELFREFEKEVNKDLSPSQRPIRVFFIPTPFDEMMDKLNQGLGDVVAAGMTITPDRSKKARFTQPYIRNVNEVVVVNREVKNLKSLEDLSGRQVYVRPGSSYSEHLNKLNASLASKNLPPIKIVRGDPSLNTDDILELVNSGVIKITVADSHIAALWARALPDIRVHEDLAVNTGGKIAWAVRKDTHQLRAELNDFIRSHRKGTLMGNIFYDRYYKNASWINNSISPQDQEKLSPLEDLFQKYGDEYGFDWLALAAQAYQESGFDHTKTSRKGAVGVMQILPSTAADKVVSIPDINDLENNIHAGAKYLYFLREHYFNSPDISPEDRVLFAWAAYNAGPGRINHLRREADLQGLDPNKWFYNVEKMAAMDIGRETVEYVANVNKYYVAFRLGYERS
ncbi:Membrane-bound lytic murein transglycosylase MltF [Desulfatibacillum alkenivorans DSM 16219]|jgi:membrane-bound lytic murein transglycosylase MltF|uniref:Membrane-bound lytic murein transglycosylase MltF n=1 Tax=Desulfatibacillum alkenivorans DSM 16219 TaxID=1121393 RepID=A0A1M7AGP7_9BACT|nr:transporter substrate-binding domain-containing protein [Desulfatibacillum alkenivorans]SHL41932.1 Membrane-bound lytic murein transglycosylase MltF [Desulfatibacillum alkenivorans DSM 16219]